MKQRFNSPSDNPLEASARRWFVRRDRGLSEAERAEFAEWLRENPAHPAAIARVEKLWGVLDPVFASRAVPGAELDPNLRAPSQRRRPGLMVSISLLAGAAAAALLWLPRTAQEQHPPPEGQVIVHPAPQRLTLEDGSTVDLNGPAKVEVQFTSTERRVKLISGEAFFTVTKNPARPFIVSSGPVAVRAVGTAFSIGLDSQEVAVLVTEGRVRVDGGQLPGQPADLRELSSLGVGEKGVIKLASVSRIGGGPEISVTKLTSAQVEHALLWQGPRLELVDRSLRDIVVIFNRYNRKQLVVHDARTAAIRVGGSFRADNVENFVRFLNVGFGVAAFPHGDELILRKMQP